MAIIMKLLRIQYALSHQDELDKQDIFLAGSKEAKNPLDLEVSIDQSFMQMSKKPVLSLDKKCLLCAGTGSKEIPALLKHFKIACLSYNPSQVKYENKIYDRN